MFHVLSKIGRRSDQLTGTAAIEAIGHFCKPRETGRDSFEGVQHFQEIALLASSSVYPRYQSLEIRDATRHLAESFAELRVVHEVLYRVQPIEALLSPNSWLSDLYMICLPGVDGVHIPKRHRQPQAEQPFAERSDTPLQQLQKGAVTPSLVVEQNLLAKWCRER
jgi:hypothetical protein